tara:strand:- start:1764 stop:2546 length:783 start_codon:yes stop_codon:yes gene_type:complete
MTDVAPLKRNALPHALDGLLPWESPEAFLALQEAFIEDHGPKGATECLLVERLVWLAWRRRRMVLAERSLHLSTLQRELSHSDGKDIAKRALLTRGNKRPTGDVKDAIATDSDDDAEQVTWNTSENEDIAKAVSILEAGATKASIAAALQCLREDSIDWWELNLLDQDPENTDTPKARAERLLAFLTGELQKAMDEQVARVEERPELRLQAWGQSLDPLRSLKLMALDGELDRQFERTLGMLLKLQAMRSDAKGAKSDPT